MSGKTGKSGKAVSSGISGPWQVSFPVDWYAGGTAVKTVAMTNLVDWTSFADADLKYFSGTATYRKSVKWNMENGKLKGGGRIVLDLGKVKDFAEVSVNGKAYPPLWRPPFRVDITEAVKESLDFEIKITNLWPNRLIGDDALYPPDCEWALRWHDWQKLDEPGIKEIPQWVREGRRSPAGRHTFTTWKHWTKKDALLPSGLLGPVSISIENQ